MPPLVVAAPVAVVPTPDTAGHPALLKWPPALPTLPHHVAASGLVGEVQAVV